MSLPKRNHEFRDPVHVFIRLDSDERKIVDSEPFQRLRHIHQLAMTYLVYPGATHCRFEHSLGCMELATRIYDTITRPENLQGLREDVRARLPEIHEKERLAYWRRILRLAALCHDLGHLPFSHAAEDLLPKGVTHETMTKRFILKTMSEVWANQEKPLPEAKLIAKIAVGAKEAKELHPFSPWESILSEIITGDVFGADRMDYLLRDSLHAGVTYGHFDHHRLIDTMRILPGAPKDDQEEYNPEPELGIEHGGLQVAESLLVARYLMFSQVYIHPVRRIYDLHLKSFLKSILPKGVYSVDLKQFVETTDSEILTLLRKAAQRRDRKGHEQANRIMHRNHFKKVFRVASQDYTRDNDILAKVQQGLTELLGAENVLTDEYSKDTVSKSDFPIRSDDGRILSAHGESKILTSLPQVTTACVFVEPGCREMARSWVNRNFRTRKSP